jgi:hypothetical protein
MKKTMSYLLLTILLMCPSQLLGTSFNRYNKMTAEEQLDLIQALMKRLRADALKTHPKLAPEIESYIDQDVSRESECELDIEFEIAAYVEWAENTGADITDYTVEEAGAKAVARKLDEFEHPEASAE